MLSVIQRFLKKEEGQGLTEYALIISLVAVALAATLTLLSGGITGTITTVIGSL